MFALQICSKAFGIEHQLKKHVAAVHEKRKDFECEICQNRCDP
jgi:hypothetical protein